MEKGIIAIHESAHAQDQETNCPLLHACDSLKLKGGDTHASHYLVQRQLLQRETVLQEIASLTGYRLISNREIIADASRLSNIPENRIKRVFSDKTSVFNRSTHERERSLRIFS